MPRVGFEPTIKVFERVKMVHALDHAATVIVKTVHTYINYSKRWKIFSLYAIYICIVYHINNYWLFLLLPLLPDKG
jgi:hypothetical protein